MAVLALVMACSPVVAASVEVVRWDGTRLSGAWVGSKDGVQVEFQAREGIVSERIDDMATITIPTGVRAPFGPVAFHLADGGVLYGNFVGEAAETVKARTLVGEVALGWNKLAAIRLAEPTQFKRANELFQEALRDRSPSQDAIISREYVEIKVLQGRLETLTPEGGVFEFAGESRNFQNEKLFGIVFATGAAAPSPSPTMFELADGSSFAGTLQTASDESLKVQSSFGAIVDIPLSDVRRLKFRSDRVTYLSELIPKVQRTEGVLHGPWPVTMDRSVLGSPLSVGGRVFERGLGVHSRTELTYALGGEYERFAATVGIDDAVRPLGSVNILVVGDGNKLLETGPLSGIDPPRDILVNVSGVQLLTLVVDYGEGLDASDHAIWGDARLLRPRKGGTR